MTPSDPLENDKRNKSSDCYYQLKVQLKGLEPPVWHHIVVHSSARFTELQSKILDAFGFKNDQASSFFLETLVGFLKFCTCRTPGKLRPNSDFWQILKTDIGQRMVLIFDVKNRWEFWITLEQILDDPKDVPARTIMRRGKPIKQYPDPNDKE